MSQERAVTRREAEAQRLTPSTYDTWVEFAHRLDGYAICTEMGVPWAEWRDQHLLKFASEPDALTLLDARLLLFFEARMLRFTSGPEPYARVNELLTLIARKSGLAYTPLTAEDIEQRTQRDVSLLMRGFDTNNEGDPGEA